VSFVDHEKFEIILDLVGYTYCEYNSHNPQEKISYASSIGTSKCTLYKGNNPSKGLLKKWQPKYHGLTQI